MVSECRAGSAFLPLMTIRKTCKNRQFSESPVSKHEPLRSMIALEKVKVRKES